ncbi:MAG: hypothetical protein FE78DRAFT_141825 [Acidomyces sp. 'richmondensis']|nr:MAG: hypothetical protein FE78DRAFT_141825 [Acidomyces sp. 'richmondensis']
MKPTQPGIEGLSNELIRLILDQIEPDPDKTVPIDRRQFLSVESFDRPPPSTRGSLRDIGRFRLTCRRFAELGAPLLFTRVAARFSRKGLQKLEQLAGWPHLARHVRKFSYLVPYFYQIGGEVRLSLQGAGDAQFRSELSRLHRKMEEQEKIIASREDERILREAIRSFTSLQLVQLLRVTDAEDASILSFIRQHEELRQFVDLQWPPACSHGSQTIGSALLQSNGSCSRFSSPMLSPQSAEFLATHTPQSFPSLAARLTCLTLHFDDGNDLDQKMSELSNLFKTVFSTAVNMQAVHIGFPSHRPLSLPLQDVFHNVTWKSLVAFGVQGWKLHADEIIDLALRHRDRLKGLRLRDVLLKDGSMWKDVLGTLRDSMWRLEWVSLRRIGYATHFDELWLAAGAEVPDDPPGGESDSESTDEDEDPMVGSGTFQGNGTNGFHHDSSADEGFNSSDDSSDDENGMESTRMDFPPLNSPVTPASSAPWCNCNGRGHIDSADDLGDDGTTVSNAKRKVWEKWVVRRCPEHSESW